MKDIIYEVLLTIENAGFEAYLVGGFIRDFLLGIKSTDVDICTNAKPKELVSLFKKYAPESLEYGNVLLHINEYDFEITTFRKEITYERNRKPIKIEYIDNLEEDLLRRDFTINTICMNKEGEILDHLGGKQDLKARKIKVVGNPYLKLEEDSLRILRAIRFATILKFKLDKDVKKAIIENKDLLKNLSYYRKKEELNKIFTSENKKYGLRLLKELDLIELLELQNINNVLLTKDPIGIWATITTNNNYSFTKNEKELMKEINELMNLNLNDNLVLYKYGLLPISVVCDLRKLSKKKYTEKYERLPIKDRIEINITAEEICEELNTEPGPFLGTLMNDIEKDILLKKVKNEKQKIIKYIKEKNIVL